MKKTINKSNGDIVTTADDFVEFKYPNGDTISVSVRNNGIVMTIAGKGDEESGATNQIVVFLEEEAKLVKELIDRNMP